MGTDHSAIEHLDQMSRFAQSRQHGEVILEDARLAEPVEPFPDAVPTAEPFGQMADASMKQITETVAMTFKAAMIFPARLLPLCALNGHGVEKLFEGCAMPRPPL